ncbi:MAG: transposase [Bdellovibrionales bacterium]|nr:transposase [Bdellovibrionales bacterium]
MAEIRFSCSPVTMLKKASLEGTQNRALLVLTVYLLALISFAKASAADSIVPLPKLTSEVLLNDKPNHRVYGQLRLEGMKYFTELPDAPNLTYSQFLSGQLSYVGETAWLENAADFSAGTFFSMNQSHIVVHELYTSPRTDGYRFYVGRKKNTWSEADHEWNLGVWQPYFELDALRPEEQGLTGVFFDVNRENWQVMILATPIFIPSVAADVREENGGLVADSRWYHAPSREAELFNNKPTPIIYQLSIPETAKLAGHGGTAMFTRFGNKEKGFWVASSAGYTPVNQLLLKRNVKYQMTDDTGGVIVSPDVTYHSVFSADMGYTVGNTRVVASYIQDNPQTVMPETDWAIQQLSGIRAYSAGVEWTIPKFFSRSILMQLSYLRVDGGNIQDIGSDGKPDDINLYDQRLKFTNAAKIKVQGELARFYRRPLVTKFSYLYDKDQKGSMVNTEFLFYPTQEWALVMGADFLGTDDETFKPSGFLNQYRANDRVYGGMTYVF